MANNDKVITNIVNNQTIVKVQNVVTSEYQPPESQKKSTVKPKKTGKK